MRNNSISILAVTCRLLSSALGVFLWFVLLVVIDDTGMWHLSSAGLMADVTRVALFLGSALLATLTAMLTNYYLISLTGVRKQPSAV